MSVFIKNIQVLNRGNHYVADISGQLSSGYQVSNISKQVNDNVFEIHIDTLPPPKGAIMAMVMGQFKQRIELGYLNPGRFAVRVNYDNQQVQWFNV